MSAVTMKIVILSHVKKSQKPKKDIVGMVIFFEKINRNPVKTINATSASSERTPLSVSFFSRILKYLSILKYT